MSIRSIVSALLVIFVSAAAPAIAQTPPGAGEIARFSPLFAAAHAGDADAVAAALAAGEEINARDPKGRTAAHIAAFASNDKALTALARAGIDMNALDHQLYDTVTIAAVADDPDFVALAIRLGNRPDLITSIYVGTALIAAAHLGHHEVVKVLIDAGAPLDHVNNLSWTAVMEAVVLGDGGPDHQATVALLVEAGADLSIGDASGITPLQHAETRGYTEIARLLRGGGA